MIAYVDSSVLLRVVLRQPEELPELSQIERGIVSNLVELECLRTIDRMRFGGALPERSVAAARETIYRSIESMEVVEVDRQIVSRASLPMPAALGALDAIHLVTAFAWQEESGLPIVMATHDRALATAARASGLSVVGV